MSITAAFDIEIYPNFFSCVIRTIATNQRYNFVIYKNHDDRQKLYKFMKQLKPLLVGYNSISFDIPILQSILLGWNIADVHKLGQAIISHKGFGDAPEIKKLGLYQPHPMDDDYEIKCFVKNIKTIDMKRLLNLDIGLKQCAIILQWSLLQELPFNPMKSVDDSQAKTLLEYNDNDVLITRDLFLKSQGDIEIRQRIKNDYGVDVINASDSRVANFLIEDLYKKATGLPPQLFKEKRTYRRDFLFGDCVGDNIIFTSVEMKKHFDRLKKIKFEFVNHPKTNEMTKLKNPFKEIINLDGVQYQLGVGGLHTKDNPAIFINKNIRLFDADVASFYPYIITHNNILPKHIEPIFIDKLKDLITLRIAEKRKGNILDATVLKIVINSIFGKLGSPTFWLYDPLAFYSVTISGQLYLLSLIDMLTSNGIKIISANTDGIVSQVDNVELYKSICDEWCNTTNFELEFSEYKQYIRRDVNSYIAQTIGGKIKTKGVFDDITNNKNLSRIINRGYNMPVVTKALKKYFIEDMPIKDFILNHDNIFDFLIAKKPSKKFQVYFDGKKVQHINRFYVSTNGGNLYKKEKNLTGASRYSIVDDKVTILNDIVKTSLDNYPNLNYDYYISETQKIINLIKPRAVKNTLF